MGPQPQVLIEGHQAFQRAAEHGDTQGPCARCCEWRQAEVVAGAKEGASQRGRSQGSGVACVFGPAWVSGAGGTVVSDCVQYAGCCEQPQAWNWSTGLVISNQGH